ncbi:MAG: hypothetical protein HRU28_16750 [Rhizobiales bacterium]|nr:hypothetical protein [Hyphomicrobiales bacterium]
MLLIGLPNFSFANEVAPKNCTQIDDTQTLTLPKTVKTMRQDIQSAISAGNIESLRVVLEQNELWPLAKIGSHDDPIKSWIDQSEQTDGRYILAQLSSILSLPFSKSNITTNIDLYVWPYFAIHASLQDPKVLM